MDSAHTSPTLAEPSATITRPAGFFALCWQYRMKLLLFGCCGLLIGLPFALMKHATYTSEATLIFPSAVSGRLAMLTGGGGDLPSMRLLDGALLVPQPGSSAGTATTLLSSRRIQEKVMRDQDLQQAWKCKNAYETKMKFLKSFQYSIGKNMELTVRFTDTSPTRAQRVMQAILRELDQAVAELGIDPARHSQTFLERQLTETEATFHARQEELRAFQERHGLYLLEEQTQARVRELTQLQQEEVEERIAAESLAKGLAATTSNTVKQIMTGVDPAGTGRSISVYYERIQMLERDLAEMRFQLTGDHPDVKKKVQELDVAKEALAQEITRHLALVESGSAPAISDRVARVAETRARAAGLADAVARMEKRLAGVPKLRVQHARMMVDLEATREAYKLLRREREKARVVAETRSPQYQALDVPSLPDMPNPRGRLQLLALCFMVGLLIGGIRPYRQWLREQEAAEARADAESAQD
ncbi:MAG: Chain length determinant protein [bacterium ADurb.Bin429]|nr:MAG: Chain length determinant protein [bacterium ADurb.Bin429]